MDRKHRLPKPNPLNNANFLSKILLVWFWPIFRKGYSGKLELKDLWDAPEDDKASRNVELLISKWKEKSGSVHYSHKINENDPENEVFLQQNGSPPQTEPGGCKHLFGALFAAFGLKYMLMWPILFINDCVLRVAQPWFMLKLIRTFVEEPVDTTAQYLYAAGVCFTTLLLTLINNPCAFYMGRLGQRCRIALASLIQRKMTRLSAGERETDSGQMTNLLTNDSSYVENNLALIPYILIAPLQLVIFMGFLWYEFGASSLAGVGFILIYMPFQYWNGSMSTLYRRKIGAKTDERVRVLEELIAAINSIKMYAWELTFEKIVQQKRSEEVKQLRRRNRLHAFQMSIFLTSSRLVPFLTFLAFVLSGGPLTADRVFYAVALYNTVTHFMVFMMPGAIRGVGEIRGSLQRIQNFLLLQEKPANVNKYNWSGVEESEGSVRLDKATASWAQGQTPILKNISFQASRDQLIMIVGKVGAGKSSLLHLIMNELTISNGNVTVQGDISYASQSAFNFAGSIRENIVFHNTFDDVRYRRVLDATDLSSDIAGFKRKGDETKVVGLSGGQKARVNLARALYQSADIYLLDDPLSAVDTRVSRHLMDHALQTFLRGKLRVVVTHQLQYLREASHVIVMDDGVIKAQGSPQQVEEIVKELLGAGNQAGDVDSLIQPSGSRETGKTSNGESRITLEDHPSDDVNDNSEEEEQAEGKLALGIYWSYFKTGKSQIQLWTYFLIFIVAQLFTTFIEYWLALWTNAEERLYENKTSTHLVHNLPEDSTKGWPASEGPPEVESLSGAELSSTSGTLDGPSWASFDDFVSSLDNLEQRLYLYVYIVLTLIVFLANLAKAVTFFHYCLRICTRVHKLMLSSVIRTQPSFFEKNPSGRIMNRFTKDMAVIDEQIPFLFFNMFTIFLQVATVIFLIILAIWYSAVAVVIFLFLLWYLRKYYVTTSRDLKRIDGTTRSPVISHIQACFEGLVTIRSLKAIPTLWMEFDTLQDDNTSATISFLAASQCFNIWIEVLATVLVAVVAFGFLLAQNYLGMSFLGGNVGLAICSAMSLTIWLQYGMKVSADVENLMISVERALEYTRTPPEADLIVESKQPPPSWPEHGALRFEGVHLSYDGSTDVLKQLTFEILSKEKVGIVGKTGAGKSSIFRALFRLNEIRQGKIVIDGVDVGLLGLHDLRTKLAIIPQEPHLFKGSLSFNLDPRTNQHDNSSKTDMLNILQMIGWRIEQKPLDFPVDGKGSNLSLGERQLVSLARVLILKRRVVCLDEATANIDSGTDKRIQQTLRTELSDCTVITIAHRLGTVIDSDRILVLSEGQLQEYGHAHELLQNKDGLLTSMVNHTGDDAVNLRARAQDAYHGRTEMGNLC